MNKRLKKLSHSVYECKYHVVFCPKYRYRILTGDISLYVYSRFQSLLSQKDGIEVLELNVQSDHIHTVLSIPPKYAISDIMGFLKGRLTRELFRKYPNLKKKYWGQHFWSRGYCVTTVGLDEDDVRRYVKWQETKEREAEQLGLSFLKSFFLSLS